jgi:hypothetical protein
MSSRGGRRGGGQGRGGGQKRGNNQPQSGGHPSKRGGGAHPTNNTRGAQAGGGRNFNNRGGFGQRGARNQTLPAVIVSGFRAGSVNANALTSHLRTLIKQVGGGSVPSGKMSRNNEACFFNFNDKESMLPLLRLNGADFQGSKLTIVEKGSGATGKPLTDETKKNVLNIVGSRYNPAEKFLNLEQVVKECNLTFENASFTKYVFDIIREYCPDVVTISFKSNEIQSLSTFASLASAAPNLQNLSFEDNKISKLQDLSNISDLQSLQQVIFHGNPITLSDPNSYLAYLVYKFPTVRVVDHVDVPRFIQFDLPDHAVAGYIPSSRNSFFMDDSCESFAMDFVPKFFDAFDSEQRADVLVDVYLPDSQFSLTVNPSPEQLEGYSSVDRNLKNSEEFDSKSSEFLVTGTVGISSFFKNMPRTRHNVSEFLADVVLVPSGDMPLLLLTVHGEYLEQVIRPNGGEVTETRYFDRVFTLANAQGSNYVNCFIINDQLHVSNSDTGRTMTHLSSLDSDGMDTPSDELKNLVQQLAQHAGISADMAYDYLVRSGNDPNAALAAIEQDRRQVIR